jgi:hypothetical protein
MRRWTLVTLAAVGTLAATAVAVALTVHSAPAPAATRQDPGPAYVQALDAAEGWPAPDAAQYATDIATGQQICDMLATGWNEAGVVANMLTWPDNRYDQAHLATAVRVTHDRLCGQAT